MLAAVYQNFILITAFATQEVSQVHQSQLLSFKLRLQTVLVRRWGRCGVGEGGGGGGGWGVEFLWSLRVELRVTMLCVNTPLVTFQTISHNDNLTLKFLLRQTFTHKRPLE